MAAFPGNEQLRLQYMGKLGPNEFLLRLAKDSGADTPAEFSSELGLTTREGEVLSWLSKGKTNRDIAQILGLARAPSTSISSRSTPSSASRTAPRRRRSRSMRRHRKIVISQPQSPLISATSTVPVTNSVM